MTSENTKEEIVRKSTRRTTSVTGTLKYRLIRETMSCSTVKYILIIHIKIKHRRHPFKVSLDFFHINYEQHMFQQQRTPFWK